MGLFEWSATVILLLLPVGITMLREITRERFDIITEIAKRFALPGPLGLKFKSSDTDGYRIYLSYEIEGAFDSRRYRQDGTKVSIAVRVDFTVPEMMPIEVVRWEILHRLRDAWLHEFEELLTYGGKPVYDPHPDGTSKLQSAKIILEELKNAA